MKLDPLLTDDAVLRELGARISRLRLNQNLSQEALAREAGISKRTLERLENGTVSVQLPALLRVARKLGFFSGLDSFIPEARPSPMSLLEMQGKARRRARRPAKPLAAAA